MGNCAPNKTKSAQSLIYVTEQKETKVIEGLSQEGRWLTVEMWDAGKH